MGDVRDEAERERIRQFIRVGREVVRILQDVMSAPPNTTAYARREIVIDDLGTSVSLFVVREKVLADLVDKAIADEFKVLQHTIAKPPFKGVI